MAEPVSTMGASAPTEPPKPMVMAEAMTDDHVLCDFSRDLFDEMAQSMRVMPCEMSSRTMKRTKSDVR